MHVKQRWVEHSRWLEYALLTIGLMLAAWSVANWIELEYFKHLPVPSQVSGSRLPGDPGESGSLSSNSTPVQVTRGTWVARLEAPSLGLQTTVLEGSDDGTLARAAGHIESTAMPGNPGNVGIAGHRDTIFRPLRNVKIGDVFFVKTSTTTLEYRVSSTKIVAPEEVSVLDPTPQPSLTLVTCYPFTFIGHAPKRFIVRAELIQR
jgi:sortase A